MNLRGYLRSLNWGLHRRHPIQSFASIVSRIVHAARRRSAWPPALEKFRNLLQHKNQVWIDIGAFHGSETLPYAKRNNWARVYALEPNLLAAGRITMRARNYFVVPCAVGPRNGVTRFFVNEAQGVSSTLRISREKLRHWKTDLDMTRETETIVPCVRLDTFLENTGVPLVTYLKVDTQGTDLEVLQSAGGRLKDILLVKAEAPVRGTGFYEGGHSAKELRMFMEKNGFRLAEQDSQSDGQEVNFLFENSSLLEALKAGRVDLEGPLAPSSARSTDGKGTNAG